MVAYSNYYTDARIKNYVDALVSHGFQVDIFALGTKEKNETSGIRVISVMRKYWGDSIISYALSQLWFFCIITLRISMGFLKKRYCLIHVHNIPDFLVFSVIVPKLLGAKVILDIHDTMPEAYATKFNLSLDHPLISFLKLEERLSAWFADYVITTNELHKQVICSHGTPNFKVDIIMNVGNERLFKPVKSKELGNGLTLVYHGTIAERLGIDLIIKAIVNTRKTCPDLNFLLIGEGDFLENIKSLVNELNLQDIVQIMGFIPVESLYPYLCKADVGIIGNRYYTEINQNYMLPVKMLEYAAMEIPTIAPRLKTIQHYFDENSAIFYAPDNIEDMAYRILEVYKDKEIINKMKTGLRKFNKEYNWQVMEKRYLSIIYNLIN